MGTEESGNMIFNRTEIIKYLTIVIAISGSWYQQSSRVNTLERESATILEFKLLQQQVTGQDEDLAEMMKVTNKILSEVTDIKIRLAGFHNGGD